MTLPKTNCHYTPTTNTSFSKYFGVLPISQTSVFHIQKMLSKCFTYSENKKEEDSFQTFKMQQYIVFLKDSASVTLCTFAVVRFYLF